jgi:hypothetical protein
MRAGRQLQERVPRWAGLRQRADRIVQIEQRRTICVISPLGRVQLSVNRCDLISRQKHGYMHELGRSERHANRQFGRAPRAGDHVILRCGSVIGTIVVEPIREIDDIQLQG